MKKLMMVLLVLALVLPLAVTPVRADTTYVVQRGDTLYAIALRFNVTVNALMAANGIANPNRIFVGQVLTIPGVGGPTPPPPPTGNTTYTVRPGDTLYLISVRFSVTMSALISANGLANANLIYVGQVLTIPGAGGGTPVATTLPQPTPRPGATPSPVPPGGNATYTVRGGDTLWAIAQRFGITVNALMTANGLNSTLIYVGQVLIIPGAGGVTPPTTGGSFELGGQVSAFSAVDKMKYAGMYWVKRQVQWTPSATANGDFITDAHNKGFKVLLSVLGSPSDINNGANFDNYAAYVGELARLGADAIEVWNEQNIDREWPTGQINPTTYTDLLRRAYQQIKAKNPNTLVISGAPAPTGAESAFGSNRVWNDDRYIAGMAAAGAANYMDCIGVHYNEGIISPQLTSGDPRDNYYTRYFNGMVNTYYNAFGGARKLCFTELGYLTPEGYTALPVAFAWGANTSVAEQSQWLGEAATLSKNSGKVRLMIVFNVDFTRYDDDPQAGFAIMRPGAICPACETLRTATGGR